MFLTLILVSGIERTLSIFTTVTTRTCTDLRTTMLGETAFENGFYHLIILIAFIAILLAVMDYAIFMRARRVTKEKNRWGLPIVNVTAGIGLLAICATPWAHFNVGHPLAERIHQVQNAIKPDYGFSQPAALRRYNYNSEVWSCSSGPCQGEPDDTRSIYTHRTLGISYRYITYYDCMTPEFNLAIRDAMQQPTDGFDGDMRRYERVFFDSEGRYIGVGSPWYDTPLMRSNLSENEKRPSPVTFDAAMKALAEFYHEREQATLAPAWTSWEKLRTLIMDGRVDEIHGPEHLVIGVRLKDGSALIGTQPEPGAVSSVLQSCGSTCDEIYIAK